MSPWWLSLVIAAPTAVVAALALLVTVRKEVASLTVAEIELRAGIVREVGQATADLVEESRRLMDAYIRSGYRGNHGAARQQFVGRSMVISAQLDAYLGGPNGEENRKVREDWESLRFILGRYNLIGDFAAGRSKRLQYAESLVDYVRPFYYSDTPSEDWAAHLRSLHGDDFRRIYAQVGSVLLSRVSPLVQAVVSAPRSSAFALRLPLRLTGPRRHG